MESIARHTEDLWGQGQCIRAGEHDNALRFWAIYRWLKKQKHPFKCLQIGGSTGYMTIRLSAKLPGHFLAVNDHPHLARFFQWNGDPQITYWSHSVNDLLLERLELCGERFDLIVLLSDVPWESRELQHFVKRCLLLTNHLIVEALEGTLPQNNVLLRTSVGQCRWVLQELSAKEPRPFFAPLEFSLPLFLTSGGYPTLRTLRQQFYRMSGGEELPTHLCRGQLLFKRGSEGGALL